MTILFHLASGIALLATLLAITRVNAVHALLYLIVSLLAVALVFFTLGAPFVAALEVIIYAGAILVLFLFVVMMLNLGRDAEAVERGWQPRKAWIGPGLLAAFLLGLMLAGIGMDKTLVTGGAEIGPKAVGILLFGPYLVAAELAAFLLLAGVVGASHLRRREYQSEMKDEP
jgi:NADH-quinone oxidoreductase subunit J